ncbi:virginiamycin B lyase [Bradyrhizobium sp. Rc2d]|uniref:Vgb family protein n=1 Tax=Bradyrhizobium sp. Rc2d TaxID=1855321 RepID=UPI00088CD8B1|nr:Virginiamycin B lyase [Bradyrhizobium sp. Rc2d]SDI18147.1 virginiamycin B lyase [Bradyrhizobium sp. Rc2d]
MRFAVASLLLAIALGLGAAVGIMPAAAQTFTEFMLPPASRPSAITTGPDGALWFTEAAGKIGRMTIDGNITEFPIKGGGVLHSITTGPDGALWFTYFRGKVGRMTTTGAVTEFTISPENSSPGAITSGPDGALWFTEPVSGKIVRMTTDGEMTEFALPNPDAQPWGIATGPDGALWFTEASCVRQQASRCIVGNRIGRITTSGSVTEFAIPSDGSETHSITTGPDGALWFTEYYGSRIGRLVLP